MKFLGLITGIALIGWVGIWYIQEKEPATWQQLTGEVPKKWRELLSRYTIDSPKLGENQPPVEPKQESSEAHADIGASKSTDTIDSPLSPQAGPQLEIARPGPPTLPEPTEYPSPIEKTKSNLSWQVFWKPFSNSLSANGFAQRISEITGLDIEVARESANTYFIQFPYRDEEERQRHIELIEDRTGLKLNFTR